ncbi:hypothetical protein HanRHA438_Chr07g0314551 [Helianthus annuus]|nr:hypothetical protein HanHA300_Chr01g0033501 [Helianthus annuus]KAJ0793918.1 hypothetical protein HanOQP8_Chr01g0034481 [Helianthus annuus]KAJ0908807.1 hypothetical protein HanRHA438_Chr07g0314551 [Helianthus annuus]
MLFTIDGLAYLELDFLRLYWILLFYFGVVRIGDFTLLVVS